MPSRSRRGSAGLAASILRLAPAAAPGEPRRGERRAAPGRFRMGRRLYRLESTGSERLDSAKACTRRPIFASRVEFETPAGCKRFSAFTVPLVPRGPQKKENPKKRPPGRGA